VPPGTTDSPDPGVSDLVTVNLGVAGGGDGGGTVRVTGGVMCTHSELWGVPVVLSEEPA
jgi:hypothetical protein